MSDDTVTVELASGIFVHGGEFKRGGDTFGVAAATADEHAELERVSGDESGGSDGENGVAAPFPPGENTVSELQDELPGGYSDEELAAAAAAERDGQNRASAIEVLEP